MKHKLAIFDLDGTLFDTTKVNFYSYKQAMEECGFSLSYDYFIQKCYGRYYKEFLPEVIGENEEVLEKIHRLKKELYSKNLEKAKINQPIFDIIDRIKDSYYIALYTTASRKNATEILAKFKQLEKFDCMLSNEDVTNKKPHPEGYLKVMEHYKIAPENTIIFEDSDVGVEAARRSKANVFIVDQF